MADDTQDTTTNEQSPVRAPKPKKTPVASVDDEDEGDDEEEIKRKEEEKRARQEKVKKRREEMRKKAMQNKTEGDEEEEASDLANTKPASKPAAPKPKIRDDLVNSSVNFLNHPRVKPSPLSQKMAFLQKKGLTQEEINEAIKRANEGSGAVPSLPTPSSSSSQSFNGQQNAAPYYPPNPQQQQMYPYPPQQVALPPPPPPVNHWYSGGKGVALLAASCVGLGIGFSALAKNYLIPYMRGESEEQKKKAQEAEEKKATEQKVLLEMVSALKSVQEKNGELKDMMKTMMEKSTNTGRTVDNSEKIRINEMEAEIKRLRSVLVDKSNSSSATTSYSAWSPPPAAKPSIPAWQQAASSANPKATSTTTTTTTTTSSVPVTATATDKDVSNNSEDAYSKMVQSQQQSTTAKGDQEPRSREFDRIFQMVQNGQIPDDVKDIDDRPRDPTQKIEKGTKEQKPKPWERKKQATQSNETSPEQSTKEESNEEESNHQNAGIPQDS